jgi:hypothetical protein
MAMIANNKIARTLIWLAIFMTVQGLPLTACGCVSSDTKLLSGGYCCCCDVDKRHTSRSCQQMCRCGSGCQCVLHSESTPFPLQSSVDIAREHSSNAPVGGVVLGTPCQSIRFDNASNSRVPVAAVARCVFLCRFNL